MLYYRKQFVAKSGASYFDHDQVVTGGGFHVGNGINWKGKVFSKMRNHTVTNRMTGVGNTLKRHYETYLLEYELAHDDADGECCLLCRRTPSKACSGEEEAKKKMRERRTKDKTFDFFPDENKLMMAL